MIQIELAKKTKCGITRIMENLKMRFALLFYVFLLCSPCFAENVSLQTSVMHARENNKDMLSLEPEKLVPNLQEESDERCLIEIEEGRDLLFLLRKLLRTEEPKRLCRKTSESPSGPHPHEGETVRDHQVSLMERHRHH